MKKTARFIALISVLCLLITALSACTGGDKDESSSVSEATSEESKAVLFGDLPDKNYNNEEFIILVPGDFYGIYASFELSEKESYAIVLNDALKARNELVEDRFGVKLVERRVQNDENMLEMVRNEVLSSLRSFDAATPYIPDAATLAAENVLYNYNDLRYIDLTNSAWDQNAVDSLSICNKTYFATGDFNLLSLACTHALVFNKDLVKDFNLENPYDIVKDGDWTLDKLREMATVVTSDVDGVSGMSSTDRYGFLVNNNYVTSMFVGSGQQLVAKDDNDVPYLAVVNNASSAATVFSKIFDLVNDSTVAGKIDDTSGDYYRTATQGGGSCWTAATQSVANKLALFRSMAIIDILDLGEYDCNFGIVPTPKFDKGQDDYRSFVSTLYATCFVVPASNTDPDRASIVIQALTEASTNTTKHAYYDVILKSRKIQDYDSEEMLDIIFGGRVYDLGVIYNWGGTSTYDTNSIGNFMNQIAFGGSASMTFTSRLEALKEKIQADLEEDIEYFRG